MTCLALHLVLLAAPVAADEAEKPSAPDFVVYFSAADEDVATSLFRVLRKERVSRVAKAETIEEAIASDADVLVLVLPDRDLPKNPGRTALDALKRRKIVGIGLGAARLFGELGLEINSLNLIRGPGVPGTLAIDRSALLGDEFQRSSFPLFDPTPEARAEREKRPLSAMFIPRWSPDADAIDVIARWSDDVNYAPIVRQGNCVLIGTPVPTVLWTSRYSDLVRRTCVALRERKIEPFTTVRRELSKPGTYEFELARGQSKEEPFIRSFYFRFGAPVKLEARLEHDGKDRIMLSFAGDSMTQPLAVHDEALNGQPLAIQRVISQADLERIGDRPWKVTVTNFETGATAKCRLTVVAESP